MTYVEASPECGDCILSLPLRLESRFWKTNGSLVLQKHRRQMIFGTQISIGTDGYHNLILRDGEWERWEKPSGLRKMRYFFWTEEEHEDD